MNIYLRALYKAHQQLQGVPDEWLIEAALELKNHSPEWANEHLRPHWIGVLTASFMPDAPEPASAIPSADAIGDPSAHVSPSMYLASLLWPDNEPAGVSALIRDVEKGQR